MAQTITPLRRQRTRVLAAGIALLQSIALAAEPTAPPIQLTRAARTQLLDLSIDDLSKIEITSVSRRPERLADAAASVYVITAEDIRRSGVTSIAEALRLAPNAQVARIDASQYAISARGFNSSTANKLLVMMDGRSLYTPLFSGVFWDVQDTALEDVERIEVVSGPGATLWGANAVNGVINIITRDARDTDGAFVSAVAGTRESGGTARFGRRLGGQGGYRIYAKYLDRDPTRKENGSAGRDGWHIGQAGFRGDGELADGRFTVLGDMYRGHIDQLASERKSVSGYNLLTRWNRPLGERSSVQVSLYYDHTYRNYPGTFAERRNTADLEAQHRFALNARHETVWGAGVHSSHDQVTNSALFAFLPSETTLNQFSLFAQHTYHWLPDSLALTLGLRADHNDYSGLDLQPNLRLAWKAAPGHLWWGSLARAARAPSRIDRDLFSPSTAPFFLAGGPDFESETVNVAEAGYRGSYGPSASVSTTLFYADYSKIRSLQPSGAGPTPLVLVNRIKGHAYGVESWGDWRLHERVKLGAGILWQRKSLRVASGAADPSGLQDAGNDPRYQAKLRLSMDLAPGWELDTMVRRVGTLPNPHVPAYTAWDLRVGWRPSKQLAVSLGGRNLLDQWHPEFGTAATRNEIERSFYAQAIWSF